MKFVELSSQLLAQIADLIAPLGFRRMPKGSQTFRVEGPVGRAIFHLSFMKFDAGGFGVTGDVAFRIHAVEELINEMRTDLSTLQKKETATVGCELGNYLSGKPRIWKVYGSDDVGPTARSIVDTFRQAGLECLRKYADMEFTFSVLSAATPSYHVHSPVASSRCSRAVALAAVLGKHKAIETLISTCECTLNATDARKAAEFRQFAERIRSASGKQIQEVQ